MHASKPAVIASEAKQSIDKLLIYIVDRRGGQGRLAMTRERSRGIQGKRLRLT
jgi:hypothetical protein